MEGVGPFSGSAEIRDRSGAVLAECFAEAWKVSARAGDTGQEYSFAGRARGVRGGADLPAQLVGKQNRVLALGGTEYRIVDATHNEILGYVDLGLRQVKPNG